MAKTKEKPRKATTKGTCPWCGGDSFKIPYTERAWDTYALIDGKLVFGESGEDVEEHSTQPENAVCGNYSCGKPVDLTDAPVD